MGVPTRIGAAAMEHWASAVMTFGNAPALLSCQFEVTSALDGFAVRLPPAQQ
jgi:hypothetical protein